MPNTGSLEYKCFYIHFILEGLNLSTILQPEILEIHIRRWHHQIKNFVALKHICSICSVLHKVKTDDYITKQASCTYEMWLCVAL